MLNYDCIYYIYMMVCVGPHYFHGVIYKHSVLAVLLFGRIFEHHPNLFGRK